MTIELNHTIVSAEDNQVAARFFARIFDLDHRDEPGHFVAVQVNESLTLDFATASEVHGQHYAFVVDEDTFDAIFERLVADDVTYGSGPSSPEDMQINHRRGGRGLYFYGVPDRHLWEIMTIPERPDEAAA